MPAGSPLPVNRPFEQRDDLAPLLFREGRGAVDCALNVLCQGVGLSCCISWWWLWSLP